MENLILIEKALEIISSATDESDKAVCQTLIEKFCECNVVTKRLALKCKDFTGDKQYSQIFMDDEEKVAVATDKHSMLISPAEYEDGKHDAVPFVWKGFVNTSHWGPARFVSDNKLEEMIVKATAKEELTGRAEFINVSAVPDKDVFMSVAIAIKMWQFGTDGWVSADPSCEPIVKKTTDGVTVLLMPSRKI